MRRYGLSVQLPLHTLALESSDDHSVSEPSTVAYARVQAVSSAGSSEASHLEHNGAPKNED